MNHLCIGMKVVTSTMESSINWSKLSLKRNICIWHLTITSVFLSKNITKTQSIFLRNQTKHRIDSIRIQTFWVCLCSELEIIVGGHFPNERLLESFTASIRYYQDELTWCVQKAKPYPKIFNIFFAATPELWFILIFGVGYVSGLIIYVMIQFDLEYENRNQRDWHYTTWLVALPAVIGINQRFHPKSVSLRLFYVFLLVMNIFIWQVVLIIGLKFLKMSIPRPQISTIAEIIDGDFHLAGTNDVLQLISHDERVISLINCVRTFLMH